MSTIKRISGPYTIQTLNPTDQINLDTPTVFINGNLVVTGNSQSIVSTDTAINDHTITLNNGVTTPNPLGANIVVARSASGSPANVFISWNETVKAWQVYNGTMVANIATSASSGIANVYADSAPTLSANLNITGERIYSTSANVQLYMNTPGSGGTGLYITNASTTGAEMVTKSKAVAYSIVFG